MHIMFLKLLSPNIGAFIKRYLNPIREPNPKDQPDRRKNLSSLSIISQSRMGADVRSYHCPPLEKPDVCGRLIFWIAFTLDSVALSYYASTFNESTNDRYPSLIGESNPKDRPGRWENLSSLSTTLQSRMRTGVGLYHTTRFIFYCIS